MNGLFSSVYLQMYIRISVLGTWTYSDPCPVITSEWAVTDLDGNVIQDYMPTPGNGRFVYNDELTLENNLMYFINVRVTDAANRTMVAISDGVVILIEPPGPGHVRDGLEQDDIDYQESTTELSANWDDFGDNTSSSPTQVIAYYEVSIGNDRREHNTRINIHYFANVGLNTSYTFTHLNLTSKTVTYYITVRAYSITGSFEEQYSNGIRVGYRDGVFPGEVEVSEFQSSTDTLVVSWDGFESDIGIKKYSVAISTSIVIDHNQTFSCSELETKKMLFDLKQPGDVGLDTLVEFSHMNLQHGQVYYVTVIAEDIINFCAAATSARILIDTTPPIVSNAEVLLNKWDSKRKDFIFVNNENQLDVTIKNVNDDESGIQTIVIKLIQYTSCPSRANGHQNSFVIQEVTIENGTETTFFNLELRSSEYYTLNISIWNNARLQSDVKAPLFSVDTSGPLAGVVKIADNWRSSIDFQSSTTSIKALTAVAFTQEEHDCLNMHTLFPNSSVEWSPLSGSYSIENVVKTPTKMTLHVGYNVPLTAVQKSGVRSNKEKLKEGSYGIRLSSAVGTNIITTFSLSTGINYFPRSFMPPTTSAEDESNFESGNYTALEGPSANSTTTNIPTSTTASPQSINSTNSTEENLKDSSSIGFGFHILGERQNNSNVWDIMLWAADRYSSPSQWSQIDTNPSNSDNLYELVLTKKESISSLEWNIELKVNGLSKAVLDGLQFDEDLFLYVQTWNKDGYEEEVKDPFNPLRSLAEFTSVTVPLDEDKDCLHGKGFYDGESGIVELWAGISDNVDEIDNIKEMELYQVFCIQCKNNCDVGCNLTCSKSANNDDFNVLQIFIDGLSLIPTKTLSDGSNATIQNTITNTSSYFMNVKLVNLAGQSTQARSNPVMIDNTPPLCTLIECTDPLNTGLDQPTKYLGSNTTIGAYWSCEENLSDIQEYVISIGTQSADDSLYEETSVKLQSKIQIKLKENKTFDDGKTYFVNLKVWNSAGLWGSYSCNSTVILTPPDVSNTVRGNLYTDSSRAVGGNVSITDQQDKIGIFWDSPNDDAEFYGKCSYNQYNARTKCPHALHVNHLFVLVDAIPSMTIRP